VPVYVQGICFGPSGGEFFASDGSESRVFGVCVNELMALGKKLPKRAQADGGFANVTIAVQLNYGQVARKAAKPATCPPQCLPGLLLLLSLRCTMHADITELRMDQ